MSLFSFSIFFSKTINHNIIKLLVLVMMMGLVSVLVLVLMLVIRPVLHLRNPNFFFANGRP